MNEEIERKIERMKKHWSGLWDKSEEPETAEFADLLEDLDKLVISRSISEDSKSRIHALIGKAVSNGYKVTRTPQKITLHTEGGPVIDKPEGDTE